MTAFLLLAGGLTCIFFLCVLTQFHKELQRRELRIAADRGRKLLHSPTLKFRSRQKSRNSGFREASTSAKVPLVETSVNVKLLVPRDT